jgi:mannose-6-phosphate isomerase-like protein (cupin superfamily)
MPDAPRPLDLEQAFATFEESFAPRIAATVNDYDVKIARLDGPYVWHAHPETDEFFLVLAGTLTIELEGGDPVVLGPHQLFTVPKGRKHRPIGTPGTRALFIEPRGTVNTGNADLTELSGDLRKHSTTGFAIDSTP